MWGFPRCDTSGAPPSVAASHWKESAMKRMPFLALIALVLAVAAGRADLGQAARSAHAGVLPPTAYPHGQTYGEWAAEWWQWALTQPTATNPILDPTGEHCADRQSGHVWFLAGSFGGQVTRHCTIPTGTALFFPVINFVWCAFPDDPPEERTEEFLRSRANAEAAAATDLTATIDGVAVADITGRYLEQSAVFTVILPADNLFGLPEGFVLDPCVDAGYYLMVDPLRPGTHTIHFAASQGDFSFDVTYEITVVPRH